ncbi:hypothetical protein IMCC12053_931 [Celeribacter marinus]|uniref:Uncharacterized protein n=1 Tax=Celeribacter marinus TaxID=1397108 RepID=A0A0N9ZN89_9RHOB|nr:hypothetical protein IMCC12053_931 [Celeribacter marinus]
MAQGGAIGQHMFTQSRRAFHHNVATRIPSQLCDAHSITT